MPNEFPDQIPLQTVVFIVNKLAMELSSKFQNSTATRPSIIFYGLSNCLYPVLFICFWSLWAFPKYVVVETCWKGMGYDPLDNGLA